ncbi:MULTISPECIES: alpha/beta fold hydrolase [Pseudonocardia]|uniref:Alpha/beta hydrolase n=1 Tax=Pseudonocardia saturnea TaxID=33909 RepID=A0ABQ0RQP5_9PSEU|nr:MULTISPECIES: alpha/beta hydrolase [Pseudonocardia]TDN71162.1 pimeloyl-ACP methyl ester carboxylesterase [Pseudonocardia autotrophica]BBG01831.1 alpha/beta hydrolase [Pseudonocardia autotrophica]GEC22997.1 alpha/beta hydrolase [Pseudonocardia saturnea]
MPATTLLELDGLRHEFDDVPGSPDLAPLLFLHEGLGSVGLWRGFHRRIAEQSGRRAVAYSRLGHGRSDRPLAPRTTSFMAAEATGVVPALCSALGLHRPIPVGHSDGGTIALLAAARLDVSGVVVLAPHVLVEDFALTEIRAARTAFEDGDLRDRMARHHDDPDAAFRGWNDMWLAEEFRAWDVRDELSAITAPVLGIQGDDDPYGSIVHVRSVAERAAGPVTVAELPCGHSPHLELPDEAAAAITGFLADLP